MLAQRIEESATSILVLLRITNKPGQTARSRLLYERSYLIDKVIFFSGLGKHPLPTGRRKVLARK
jgi:hypothetical protein